MYDRLLFAAAFIAGFAAVCKLIHFIVVKKAGENLRRLKGRRRGVPLIVYFTSSSCGVCKAAQAPALKSLQNKLGSALQVVTFNVDEQMEMAKRWNVMTLPTTFVFNSCGELVHHNIGLADAGKLFGQLGGGALSVRELTGVYGFLRKNFMKGSKRHVRKCC